jgi:hypothetical protein
MPSTGPNKEPTTALLGSTGTTKDPASPQISASAVAGDTGTPKDPARMLALSATAPAARPFGTPDEASFPPDTKERRVQVARLLKHVAGLLAVLQPGHLAGTLSAHDDAALHALQDWYSALLAEQRAHARR